MRSARVGLANGTHPRSRRQPGRALLGPARGSLRRRSESPDALLPKKRGRLGSLAGLRTHKAALIYDQDPSRRVPAATGLLLRRPRGARDVLPRDVAADVDVLRQA